MSGRFDVDAVALRRYADDLARYAGQAKAFGAQVGQADVGDASWGIVGLFAKDKYTETVQNLQEFLRSAEGYASGLDERMRAAGDTYDEMDGSTKAALDALSKRLGGTTTRYHRASTPGGGEGYGSTGEFADFGADGYTQQQEQEHNDGSREQAVSSLVADGASFVNDCYSQMQGIGANPLQWLVNMGLGFLLEVVSPLQDLLEMVSGDPQALEQASAQFLEIEQGLQDMRHAFTEDTRDRLVQWGGAAAQRAKQRLTELAVGTGEAAGRAGSLAELLAVSAIVMEVIYDLIKSILSELVTFLIELWLPALAAAVTSFGASVAAATATTAVKTTQTVATTTTKVKSLADLLQKLVQVFLKLAVRAVQEYFKFQGDAARRRAEGQAARDGARAPGGIGGARPYQPAGSGYGGRPGFDGDGPGGWGGGRPGYQPDPSRYPGGIDVDRPDFGAESPRRPVPDFGLSGGSNVRDHRSGGLGSGDFAGGTAAAGFGPSGAGGLPGGDSANTAAGAQSGVAQQGAGAARGAAGVAAGGGAAGGMMGGAGAGGGGRGQGGEDREHKSKSRVTENAEGLFGPDELTPPPVIGE